MNISDNQNINQENSGFWRLKNIVVLSIILIIVAGGVYFLFDYVAPIPKVKVQSEHIQCNVSDDCVMVATQCSCDCGTPVNKDYQDFYNDKVDDACEGYKGMMCSMNCNYAITCDSGVCAKHEVTPSEHEIQEIELVVNAPFSEEIIRFYASGVVDYFFNSEINENKISEQSRVEIEDYNELADFIGKSDFYDLDEYYNEENLLDATAYTITITKQNSITSTKVSCYGECPDDAVEIRKQILELWGGELLNIGV